MYKSRYICILRFIIIAKGDSCMKNYNSISENRTREIETSITKKRRFKEKFSAIF